MSLTSNSQEWITISRQELEQLKSDLSDARATADFWYNTAYKLAEGIEDIGRRCGILADMVKNGSMFRFLVSKCDGILEVYQAAKLTAEAKEKP